MIILVILLAHLVALHDLHFLKLALNSHMLAWMVCNSLIEIKHLIVRSLASMLYLRRNGDVLELVMHLVEVGVRLRLSVRVIIVVHKLVDLGELLLVEVRG